MRRRKTQNIIFIYLLLILLFFAFITYFAFHINSKKRDIFIQSNINQVERSINMALDFETNRIHLVSVDYSYWDEMVSYINNKDEVWAKTNIDPIISTFKVSSTWVVDTFKNQIYCTVNDSSKLLKDYNFDKTIIDSLNSSRLIQYYDETPNGIIQVFGATIHPSNDPKRLTKPQGYLFISKVIDSKYIKTLSEITDTKVSLISDTLIPPKEYQIVVNKPLSLYNSKCSKYLHFEKDFPFIQQYNKFSTDFIWLYCIAALCFIITFLFVTTRWINKPLSIVEEVLESEDIQKVKSLNRFGREFVKIGDLISDFISQKKSLEVLKDKAEESDRLKSAFMANMSHEIRTPLNGIMGFSELLCNTDLTEEAANNYRKIIQKCSNSLMRLIGDILDYSKIEAGQLVIKNESFCTATFITDLSNHYESKREFLSQRGIQLVFNYSGGFIDLNTDKHRLKQILTNLIGNAIKFTEKGKIEVDYYKNCQNVIFVVKDTGIGISQEQQQIIFKSFWQAAQPKSKTYGGTGLGLALSQGLANLLGGEVRVESQVEVGSTFNVTIKINNQEDKTI